MTRNLLIIVSILTLLSSCEGIVSGNGKVISSIGKTPISDVRIKWRFEESFTDSLGNFEISEFVSCPAGCPELELILTKSGYETKYVNLTKGNPNKFPIEGIIIELTPTDKAQADIWNNGYGRFLYFESRVIALLGLITLILLFIIKLQYRVIWFFTICFGNIALHFNILTHTLEFKIFRPVTYINPLHSLDPAWYKFNLPLGLITFWIYYLMRLRKKTSSK